MSGPDDERDPEHGPEQALVLAALLRGEHVADDRERHGEQRTGADALDASEQDQHAHVLAEAGQRRADQEDGDAEHVDRLATEEVRALAPERDGDRAGEQVDRDRPDVVVVARQLGHDGWQRRTDDRLVEGAEEQAEHDGEEDFHLRPVAQAESRIILERGCRGLVTDGDAFHETSGSSFRGRSEGYPGRDVNDCATSRSSTAIAGWGWSLRADSVQEGRRSPRVPSAPPRRRGRWPAAPPGPGGRARCASARR